MPPEELQNLIDEATSHVRKEVTDERRRSKKVP
jgi:hypothetical protein